MVRVVAIVVTRFQNKIKIMNMMEMTNGLNGKSQISMRCSHVGPAFQGTPPSGYDDDSEHHYPDFWDDDGMQDQQSSGPSNAEVSNQIETPSTSMAGPLSSLISGLKVISPYLGFSCVSGSQGSEVRTELDTPPLDRAAHLSALEQDLSQTFESDVAALSMAQFVRRVLRRPVVLREKP